MSDVGEQLHVLALVAGEDGGLALIARAAQQVAHGLDAVGVEAVERLVDQHALVLHERLRQGRLLLVAVSSTDALDVDTWNEGLHLVDDPFGLGTVTVVEGAGDKTVAHVDFGSEGTERLLLRYAPVQKL